MSLFESLDTSAGGMSAQAKATSIISTNIANVTTTGYKRSEASFQSLVTTSRFSPSYEPGGVTATRVLRADQQGTITQTASNTDVSVSGNGFFVIGRNSFETADSATDPTNLFFTRNGSFSELSVLDSETGTAATYLANAPGQFLYAWPIDNVSGLPASQDFSTLQTVNISQFDSIPIPTTQLEVAFNLDANAEDIDVQAIGGQLPASAQAASFVRNFNVFDEAGQPQELSFEFRKIIGPMAHFGSRAGGDQSIQDTFIPTTGTGDYAGIANGDSFSVDIDGVSETYTFVNELTGDDIATNQIATMNGLVSALNQHGVDPLAVPPVTTGVLEAQVSNGRLIVRAVDPTATIELAETSGTPLSGIETLNINPDPADPTDMASVADFIFEPDEDINAPVTYPDQGIFPAIANTTNPVPQNWWELTIVNPANGATISQGLLNYNGDGSLNATPDADGNLLIDLATTPIDWDGDPATPGSGITVDITRNSQFAGNYQIISSDQNGAGIGTRTGLDITNDGRIQAVFSNGIRADLYQIPLANFPSENELNDISGTLFAISGTSGNPVLDVPGGSGNGILNGGTLENSNVDIGNEFGQLIVSQRGYTLNSQVIQAINEMAERLGQL